MLCDSHDANKTAFHYENDGGNKEVYTYGKLKQESLVFAKTLQGLGVKKVSRVAVLLPKSPEFIILALTAAMNRHKLNGTTVGTDVIYTDNIQIVTVNAKEADGDIDYWSLFENRLPQPAIQRVCKCLCLLWLVWKPTCDSGWT